MITNISIANYRSFGYDLSVELAPLSVFIGPNAAGKTNFVDAFRFVQESAQGDIAVAANRRAGWSGIRCRRRRSRKVSFGLRGVYPEGIEMGGEVEGEKLRFVEMHFELAFSFQYQIEDDAYVITEEQAELRGKRLDDEHREEEVISSFWRTEHKVSLHEPFTPGQEELPLSVSEANRDTLFTGTRFYSLVSIAIGEEIADWCFYDPDPHAARLPSNNLGTAFMSESGSTLALVLHALEKQEEKRTRLLNLMQTLVPGFEDWGTELRKEEGQITFRIKEKRLRGTLPPGLISDGTIRLLVILSALLYPKKPPSAVFIEEPGRGLHPSVMGPLVDFMREASAQTQIIVTTHNPEFVRHCRPGEVYLMDKIEGLTQVVRASSIAQIDKFLELFALDELWLQGQLELGIPL